MDNDYEDRLRVMGKIFCPGCKEELEYILPPEGFISGKKWCPHCRKYYFYYYCAPKWMHNKDMEA